MVFSIIIHFSPGCKGDVGGGKPTYSVLLFLNHATQVCRSGSMAKNKGDIDRFQFLCCVDAYPFFFEQQLSLVFAPAWQTILFMTELSLSDQPLAVPV